jgi:hypothetical protein
MYYTLFIELYTSILLPASFIFILQDWGGAVKMAQGFATIASMGRRRLSWAIT